MFFVVNLKYGVRLKMELDLLIKHKENLYGDKALYTKFKTIKDYKPSFEGTNLLDKKVHQFKEIITEISKYKLFNQLCKLPKCAVIIIILDKNQCRLILCHIGTSDTYDNFVKNAKDVLQDHSFTLKYASTSSDVYFGKTNYGIPIQFSAIKVRKHSYESINVLLYSHIMPGSQVAIYQNRIVATLLGKHFIESDYSVLDEIFLPKPKINMGLKKIVINKPVKGYYTVTGYNKYGHELLPVFKYPNHNLDGVVFRLNNIITSLTDCILLGSTSSVFDEDVYKTKEELILEAQILLSQIKNEYISPSLILYKTICDNKVKKYKNTPCYTWFSNLITFVNKCRESPNEMPQLKKRFYNPYFTPYINQRIIKCNATLISAHDNRLLKIYMILTYYLVPDILRIVMMNLMLLDKLSHSNVKLRNTSLYPWLKGYLINNSLDKCPNDDNYKSITCLLDRLYVRSNGSSISVREKKCIITAIDTIIKKYSTIGYDCSSYQ